jgi:methyltransferase (TIGR00027 family)
MRLTVNDRDYQDGGMSLFRRRRGVAPPAGSGPLPSLTSQAVARVRAGLDRPATPTGDPTAQQRLTSDLRTGGGPGLRAHMATRTAFVDAAVLAAIADGIPQVVVVGAGYDDRALRFRAPGVTFYEVDQPVTQDDKRRRLRALGAEDDVRFVAADLRDGDLAERLAHSGHNACAATLFIAEGLLVYLDEPVVRSVLSQLRARAAARSRLVASLAIHRDGVPSRRAVEVANARRRDASAEPWRTILSRDAHLTLLRDSGWTPTREQDIPSASGTGGTLLVEAVGGGRAEETG